MRYFTLVFGLLFSLSASAVEVRPRAFVPDNSTLETSGSTLRVKDSGISTAKIAASAVTAAKLATLNTVVSSSTGSLNWTTAGDVTNLSVSITTTGRPVQVCIEPDGTDNNGGIVHRRTTSASTHTYTAHYLRYYRDSTVVGRCWSQAAVYGDGNIKLMPSNCNAMCVTDSPAAGTYTYKIHATPDGAASDEMTFSRVRLRVTEIH